MSTKKYLTLEAAAAQLGIKPEELIRLREKGDVRGFADRGTWKFRSEDVEELIRRREPDSSPEVPMIDDDEGDSKSMPTLIAYGRDVSSDSDVRLVPDDKARAKLSGSSAELKVKGSDSDSDVRLSEDPRKLPSSDSDVQLVSPRRRESDSDSDVKLADSDSDVRLDSDSDVRLASASSDSDVQLVKGGRKKSSDSDVSLLPKAGAPKAGAKTGKGAVDLGKTDLESVLADDSDPDSGIRLAGDSGIALSTPADSGILLEGPGDSPFPMTLSDSEISLKEDSGITLEPDSGLALESDSGISIAGDSGIRLQPDSGIRLSDSHDSDIKLQGTQDDLEMSVPMLLSDDDGARTDAEVPLLTSSDEAETLNIPAPPAKKKGDTSILMLAEDENANVEFAAEEEDEAYGLSTSTADSEELEVSEDILGDDGDLEQMEVFESDESVFDESFEEGTSAAELSVVPGRIAVPDDVEWSNGFLSLLTASTVVMFLGAILAADLLRTVWGGSAGAYPGELIGMFAYFLK